MSMAVRVEAEVTRQIRQHARGNMSAEVCGVLIGDLPEDGAEVAIFAAIAGANAAQAGTHVTFTQDTWEHIYKVKDAEYPAARIVGWYHSHPGFGVFLSEHDTFIQENFFSAAGQVAWVFDPHTDEEGCFGWVEGSIARLGSITVVDSDAPGRVSESRELAAPSEIAEVSEGEPRPKSRRVRARTSRVRLAASALAVLVAMGLGFLASRTFFPVISLYPLLVPVDASGQPLLHDPKTGGVVYFDPLIKKYVVPDTRSGKLRQIDPAALKAEQPAAEGSPESAPPPNQTAPTPIQSAPKEKK